jgi:hypothetical protein
MARFSVQFWRLGAGERKPRALTPLPNTVSLDSGDVDAYLMMQLDTAETERLALIIVRLDGDESIGPAGGYSITLGPSE